MLTFSDEWADAVLDECDPIFETADVGFSRGQKLRRGENSAVAALHWQAKRGRFAERYPESGLADHFDVEGFEASDDVAFWVTPVAPDRARLEAGGCWNIVNLQIGLDGDGNGDGQAIADVFARLLAVTSPRVETQSGP